MSARTDTGVVRLGPEDAASLGDLLGQDPVANLFLVGTLANGPVERSCWYGVVADGRVRAALLLLPDHLAVPYAPDPRDAAALGTHLAGRHDPCLVVGPREACDVLVAHWWRGHTPSRRHDQRVYRLETLPTAPDPAGFRVARRGDIAVVAVHAAAMEREDLGTHRNRSAEDHAQVVQERIRSGRTWVIERERSIVFQVNIGTAHPSGYQIGGTWVPPEHRGQGLATAGVAALCRRLLVSKPRVTLHVNEANGAAVRVYERVGFVRDAAFRLLIP